MIVAYFRERWSGPTIETALAIADVSERGVEYDIGKASDNAWWVWQTLGARVWGRCC